MLLTGQKADPQNLQALAAPENCHPPHTSFKFRSMQNHFYVGEHISGTSPLAGGRTCRCGDAGVVPLGRQGDGELPTWRPPWPSPCAGAGCPAALLWHSAPRPACALAPHGSDPSWPVCHPCCPGNGTCRCRRSSQPCTKFQSSAQHKVHYVCY